MADGLEFFVAELVMEEKPEESCHLSAMLLERLPTSLFTIKLICVSASTAFT